MTFIKKLELITCLDIIYLFFAITAETLAGYQDIFQMRIFLLSLLLWKVWVSVCDDEDYTEEQGAYNLTLVPDNDTEAIQFTPLTLDHKPLKLLLTGECDELHPYPSEEGQS